MRPQQQSHPSPGRTKTCPTCDHANRYRLTLRQRIQRQLPQAQALTDRACGALLNDPRFVCPCRDPWHSRR
mgnify:CR=1 FL=1